MLILGFIVALFISVLGWWIIPLMIIDGVIENSHEAKPKRPQELFDWRMFFGLSLIYIIPALSEFIHPYALSIFLCFLFAASILYLFITDTRLWVKYSLALFALMFLPIMYLKLFTN